MFKRLIYHPKNLFITSIVLLMFFLMYFISANTVLKAYEEYSYSQAQYVKKDAALVEEIYLKNKERIYLEEYLIENENIKSIESVTNLKFSYYGLDKFGNLKIDYENIGNELFPQYVPDLNGDLNISFGINPNVFESYYNVSFLNNDFSGLVISNNFAKIIFTNIDPKNCIGKEVEFVYGYINTNNTIDNVQKIKFRITNIFEYNLNQFFNSSSSPVNTEFGYYYNCYANISYLDNIEYEKKNIFNLLQFNDELEISDSRDISSIIYGYCLNNGGIAKYYDYYSLNEALIEKVNYTSNVINSCNIIIFTISIFSYIAIFTLKIISLKNDFRIRKILGMRKLHEFCHILLSFIGSYLVAYLLFFITYFMGFIIFMKFVDILSLFIFLYALKLSILVSIIFILVAILYSFVIINLKKQRF